MTERWLPVVGFEGSYEVSDLGRVRSLDRTIVEAPTGRARRLKGRMLRPGRATNGYMLVMLGRGNPRNVHVLVLEAFVGPCPDGMECLHWDDVKPNNTLGNLRWGTRSQNLHDAVRTGRKPVAEKHPGAKLSNDDVRTIRALVGVTQQQDIAANYGIGEATVSQIVNRKSWKSI